MVQFSFFLGRLFKCLVFFLVDHLPPPICGSPFQVINFVSVEMLKVESRHRPKIYYVHGLTGPTLKVCACTCVYFLMWPELNYWRGQSNIYYSFSLPADRLKKNYLLKNVLLMRLQAPSYTYGSINQVISPNKDGNRDWLASLSDKVENSVSMHGNFIH